MTYPNVGPTNDCYLEVYFFKYRLIIDYTFFNLYRFKVSSKSTLSLLFWGLIKY